MSNRKKTSNRHVSQAGSGISALSLHRYSVLIGVVLITVAALIAYFPSINGGFILDDDELLTNNSLIKAPDGLYRFCTREAADFWPVTNTTLWIEWRLWGMNPTGYHVTNLILHVVEALLIWIILRKMSIPGAFFAALLFAVHPVNVESVAWISQRKNMMAMLFFLLSILCYLKYGEQSPGASSGAKHTLAKHSSFIIHHSLFYWLSLAAFLLAMLSKGSVVIMPVLLLGIVWWLRPLTSRDIVRTAPFFFIAVVLGVVNVWFQTHGSGEPIRSAGFVERLLGAGGMVWFYLYKAFWPINLAFVYPQWIVDMGDLLWWLPLLAVLIVSTVLWWHKESWSRPVLFAWGFICTALAPVMGFTDVFFMKYSLVADHYQHIAIIGIIALVSAGFGTWHMKARGTLRLATLVIAVAAISVLIFLTWRQSGLYRDQITLYQDTLQKNPACWMAYNNYGKALFEAGEFEEAIDQFSKALSVKSDYAEAYNNLGGSLVQLNRPEEAVEHIKKAMLLKLDYPEAQNNMGNYFLKMGRTQEAFEWFQNALALKPEFPEAHNNFGVALVLAGRPSEAIGHFQEVLRLKPDHIDAYNNLGHAFIRLGRHEEAIENFRQAVEIARSKNQLERAKQIEEFFNSYRAGIGK